MSSFLKDLIAKHKDKKYGKGHRLGDTPTQQAPSYNLNSNHIAKPSTSSQSDAARRAGEAALQRLQNTNKPVRPVSSVKHTDNELEKALALKDHYFGKKQKIVDNVSTASTIKIYFKSSVFQPGEKYTLDEVEDKIEQNLIQNLEIEPILVSVSLLMTANYKYKEKLDKCIEIINKFVDNILANPSEEKFRKIRLENPTFKEKVYSCKYADMVLKNSGFIAKTVKLDDGSDDDIFLYEGNDMEKLENLKMALSVAEPVMPELDRDIKIFKVSESNSNNLNNFSLSDDFFNLKIEELRKEQALRNEAVEKAGMLRTKAMRERDEQLELRRYNYSLIRVKFPDNFILQGLFKSNEKYDILYELIQNSINFDNIPFELVSHSIKKPSGNGNLMGLTLAEIGLVPSALLNFKINEMVDPRIKNQIKFYLKADLLDLAINF
ncbi:unnamed protein product [Brachionus calyciflorus]|uniref:UBX domain-containing protein n=1 Tax=Brachionus calyciflorus TaxID=104777 RepID=A0A813Q990_9BILA|nr:unnamed protein product [Brachionus calyciflorus]